MATIHTTRMTRSDRRQAQTSIAPNYARRPVCATCIDLPQSTCRIAWPAPPKHTWPNNGQVLGVILGSLRSDITGRQRTRHMLRRHCLTLPLLASHEGRHGLLAQLAILQADEALKHDAGKEYEAEVVLFVVSPAARGMGVGRRLFNHMLGVFHDAGLREYFLFTDSTCDVGFYDHRGLIRKAERDDRNDGSSRPNPTDSSSSGLTVGTTSLLADDEPMSYFLYEGRC